MTPFRAFTLWRALRERPVFEEDEATIAGRRGEAGIDRVLAGDATSLWSGRRVPRPRGRGRVEIDHILLTDRALYLVETKAWTGAVRIEGEGLSGNWIQTRAKNRGEVDHGGVWGKLESKAHALGEYLREKGIPLEDGAIRPVLIFWNPTLRVPRWLEDRPEVVTRRELDAAMRAETGRSDGLLGLLLLREGETHRNLPPPIPLRSKKRIQRLLNGLGGYDRLVLRGGRTITGDFRAIRRANGRVLANGARLKRAPHIRYFPGLHGFLRACLGAPPAVVVLDRGKRRLYPEDEVLFHEVGRPQVMVLSAWLVDRIEKG